MGGQLQLLVLLACALAARGSTDRPTQPAPQDTASRCSTGALDVAQASAAARDAAIDPRQQAQIVCIPDSQCVHQIDACKISYRYKLPQCGNSCPFGLRRCLINSCVEYDVAEVQAGTGASEKAAETGRSTSDVKAESVVDSTQESPVVRGTRPPCAVRQHFHPHSCPSDPNVHRLLPHCDCCKYYHCVHGRRVEMSCPPGLHFNARLQVCDWPQDAGCSYLGSPLNGTTTQS